MVNQSRKVTRRIRMSGYAFMVISLLVLLAAWNTGANLLYIVFGGLLSFLVLSFALSRPLLRNVEVERETPESVHRGQEALITVKVTNNKRFWPALSVRVEHDGGQALGHILRIPAQSAAYLHIAHRFDKRGIAPMPAVRLVTAFPFGLVERAAVRDIEREVVVFPRVGPVNVAVAHRDDNSGHTPQRALTDGTDFFSLREYVPGDDTRHIAWRSSARVGSLVVRELEVESARTVLIVLDTRALPSLDGFEDIFEECVELAASIGAMLLKRRFAVGLETPGVQIGEGEGQPQLNKLLHALARVEPTDDGGGRFRPLAAKNGNGAAIIYLSPDPRSWGTQSPLPGVRVINPREVSRV